MNATIIARTPTSFTLPIEVPYNDSRLDFDETLQQRPDEAGVMATTEGLRPFDTDGAPITVGAVTLTTKGPIAKGYQTPYGVAAVARHVYRSPRGGPTDCPLDRGARIVVSPTPRFAEIPSPKYAAFSSPRARVDLRENHGRVVSRGLIQDVADAVAAAAMIGRAKAKCPDAHYMGIADGARGNWGFLGRHTDVQVTDSRHAAGDPGEAAVVLYRGHRRTKEAWPEDACHRTKHEVGGAGWVLKQLPTGSIPPWSAMRVHEAKRYLDAVSPSEGSWAVSTVTRTVAPATWIREGSIAVTVPDSRSVIVPEAPTPYGATATVTRASGVIPGRPAKAGPGAAPPRSTPKTT